MLATIDQPSGIIPGSQAGQRVTIDQLLPYAQAVINSVRSEHSKRAYERGLKNFFQWFLDHNQPELSKATVQAYIDELRGLDLGPVTINQRLTAVKNLVKEAIDNGVLNPVLGNGILRVKGERHEGQRLGNWLTKEQAQKLLNAPDVSTLKGLRDRAILAVFLFCALRRNEVASLKFSHIQQREGRWVIIDLEGKRKKARSVPMPAACKAAVDAWATAAGLGDGSLPLTQNGYVFRPVSRWDKINGEQMTAQNIYMAVKHYCDSIGVDLGAHDLRRTCAKLMKKNGGDLLQIQLILGHESVDTTKRYLGERLELSEAPNDKLGLSLSAD